MAFWEFIVIAGLLGSLLVYASVLASRIGRTNALLKKVEALLLLKGELVVPAAAGGDEMVPPAEVVEKEVQSAPFLTMRDLKVRSEEHRARAVSSNSEQPDPIVARRRSESGNPFAGRFQSSDGLYTSGELTGVYARRDESRDSVAVSSESGETESIASDSVDLESVTILHANDELPSAPASELADDDSGIKKEQDAWLILNSQRRRRRTRYGY